MILEEVYGNLATIYFQGTKEKIISILDHTYEKMPHNQSEGSNSNRMGICVFRNLTSSERQTNGHYGVLKKSDRLDNKNWKLQRSVETKYFNY